MVHVAAVMFDNFHAAMVRYNDLSSQVGPTVRTFNSMQVNHQVCWLEHVNGVVFSNIELVDLRFIVEDAKSVFSLDVYVFDEGDDLVHFCRGF